MYMLNALWRGQISPNEKYTQYNAEYKRLSAQIREEYKALMNELSEEGKEHLEAYERLMLEAQSIGDEETFIEAFRLGARMMLDVLEEPKVNVR